MEKSAMLLGWWVWDNGEIEKIELDQDSEVQMQYFDLIIKGTKLRIEPNVYLTSVSMSLSILSNAQVMFVSKCSWKVTVIKDRLGFYYDV